LRAVGYRVRHEKCHGCMQNDAAEQRESAHGIEGM
jgi:hypothetical protein